MREVLGTVLILGNLLGLLWVAVELGIVLAHRWGLTKRTGIWKA